MAQNNDFITLGDLEDLGLDLSTEEAQTKAQAWISYASSFLRQIARNNGVDIDLKIALDQSSGGFYLNTVKMVVSKSVLRANSVNVEIPDATRYAQTATPYSESISYGNASPGEVFFKQKELQLLGFKSVDGKPTFSALRGVRG